MNVVLTGKSISILLKYVSQTLVITSSTGSQSMSPTYSQKCPTRGQTTRLLAARLLLATVLEGIQMSSPSLSCTTCCWRTPKPLSCIARGLRQVYISVINILGRSPIRFIFHLIMFAMILIDAVESGRCFEHRHLCFHVRANVRQREG